MISHYT